jgi:REP element-mobilizing transposase RayT
MATTYTQLYVHVIFAVHGEESKLNYYKQLEVYGFIDNLIEEMGHKMLIANGTEDHIHILIKINPSVSIASLVREIKRQSSFYINHHILKNHGFNWQEGYSAFTHTRSQVNAVYKYIEKQKDYHQDVNFREEYLNLNEIKEDTIIDDTIFKLKYQ